MNRPYRLPATPRDEKAVGSDCDAFASALGWRIERYEQTRATKIALGIPDRRYVGHSGWRVWVELKKPGGKLTIEQHAWLMAELDAGGLAVVVDDFAVLKEVLWRVKLYGQTEAIAYCREVVTLTASRGFRGHRVGRTTSTRRQA
jgi:hypothetical protein